MVAGVLLALICGGCAHTWESVASDPVDLEALSAALQAAESGNDEIRIEEDRRLADAPQDAALSLLDQRADKFGNLDAGSFARAGLRRWLGGDHDNDSIPEGVWREVDEPWEVAFHETLPAALPETLEARDAMLAEETLVPAPTARPEPVVVRAPELPPPPKATQAPKLEALSDLDKHRTHYLRNTTKIVGETITLSIPPSYAHRVRWVSGTPRPTADGGQRAEGGAQVQLTNLTLEGRRITVRVRGGADASIQITARGNVAIASRVQDRLVREAGLRTLLITNDRMVPLR